MIQNDNPKIYFAQQFSSPVSVQLADDVLKELGMEF